MKVSPIRKSFVIAMSVLVTVTSVVASIARDASAAEDTEVQFVVLRGPNSGDWSFIQTPDLQRATSRQIKESQTFVDDTTPIPSVRGTRLVLAYPKGFDSGELSQIIVDLRHKARNYGLSAVERAVMADTDHGLQVFVRHGIAKSDMPLKTGSIDWLVEIAEEVASGYKYPPRIEFFDQSKIPEYPRMGGGDEFSISVDMEGDYGGGDMSSIAVEPSSVSQRRAAPLESYAESAEFLLSWSQKKRAASAISTSKGGRWTTVKLDSDDMREPVIGTGIVAFWCGYDIYAFSASAQRWDVLRLGSPVKEAFDISATGVTIRTGGDFHVFTAASGRWASLSHADAAEYGSSKHRSGDQYDPFGVADVSTAADPFGGGGSPLAEQNASVFADDEPSDDPFAGTSDFGQRDSAPDFSPDQIHNLRLITVEYAKRIKAIEKELQRIVLALKEESGDEAAQLTERLKSLVHAQLQQRHMLQKTQVTIMKSQIVRIEANLADKRARAKEILAANVNQLLRQANSKEASGTPEH